MSARRTAASYVHEGRNGRWYVAEWVERAAQYQWPLPERIRQASGCSGGFSRRCEGSDWSYRTRAQALAAARRIYGEVIALDREEAEHRARMRSDPQYRAAIVARDRAIAEEIEADFRRDIERADARELRKRG